MKILYIASAFHRAEAFASVCKAFEKLGHTVTYYPIYMRISDLRDQITKSGSIIKDINAEVISVIKDEVYQQACNHDMALFWKAEALDPITIKNCGTVCKTVYYSWDDPYQLEVDSGAMRRAAACHLAASCCEISAHRYLMAGADKAIWLPAGYDPEVHYEDGNPEIDVVFVATNTYCKEIYGNQVFDRRDIIRAVLQVTKNIELWGRGDEVLGWTHPVHGDPSFAPYYKGWVKFEEARKVFSRARVCLNSHVRRSGYKYLNERTFQIMGCNRLLMIDNNPGTEQLLGQTAIPYSSINELQNKLHRILNPDYQTSLDIEKIKQAMTEHAKNFTWDRFAERLTEAAK